MISILFVALFHWNVDRDSSPRHKAIPVLFQVFPLFPLVLCVAPGSTCSQLRDLCFGAVQHIDLSSVQAWDMNREDIDDVEQKVKCLPGHLTTQCQYGCCSRMKTATTQFHACCQRLQGGALVCGE
jgi:hypothetical protein